jgi:hypothetical protein
LATCLVELSGGCSFLLALLALEYAIGKITAAYTDDRRSLKSRLAHIGSRRGLTLIANYYSGSSYRPLQVSQFGFHTKKKTLLENHWRNNLSIRSPLHHVLQHSEPVSRLLFSPRHRPNDYTRHFLFTIITWIFKPDFILGMRVYQYFDFRGKA